MTIAKHVFGIVAAIIFALKTIGVTFGNIDMIAAGLLCLTIAVAL